MNVETVAARWSPRISHFTDQLRGVLTGQEAQKDSVIDQPDRFVLSHEADTVAYGSLIEKADLWRVNPHAFDPIERELKERKLVFGRPSPLGLPAQPDHISIEHQGQVLEISPVVMAACLKDAVYLIPHGIRRVITGGVMREFRYRSSGFLHVDGEVAYPKPLVQDGDFNILYIRGIDFTQPRVIKSYEGTLAEVEIPTKGKPIPLQVVTYPEVSYITKGPDGLHFWDTPQILADLADVDSPPFILDHFGVLPAMEASRVADCLEYLRYNEKPEPLTT